MLIVFQGTAKRGYNVGAITVMSAALEAFRKNQKVCIISLRSRSQNNNIEDFAFPQEYAGNNENASNDNSLSMIDSFQFKDNGMDGLIRRAEAGHLRQEQFNNCVTPTMTVKNGLDIVGTSSETDFEYHLLERMDIIQQILKVANEIYHYVFVYISSENQEFVNQMNALADKIVVVARQGKREQIIGDSKTYKDKFCMLITDFEAESSFTANKMKRMYGVDRLFILPHNVKFQDAKENRSLIRFAMKNTDPSKMDNNYAMIKELKSFVDFIDNKEPEAANDIVSEMEYLRLDPKRKAIHPLEEHSVEVQEETVEEKKSGFFKPLKTYVRAVFTKKARHPQNNAKTDSSTDETNTISSMSKDESEETEMVSTSISADILNSPDAESEMIEDSVTNTNDDAIKIEDLDKMDPDDSAEITSTETGNEDTGKKSILDILNEMEEEQISDEMPENSTVEIEGQSSNKAEELPSDDDSAIDNSEQTDSEEDRADMDMDNRIKDLYDAGYPIDQISLKLGITEDEVYTRYAQSLIKPIPSHTYGA